MSKWPWLVVAAAVIITSILLLRPESQPSTTEQIQESVNEPESPQQVPGATHQIMISGSKFQTAILRIKQGDTVTWLNQDSLEHTVTADSGAGGPDSQNLGRGQSYSFTFSGAGTYRYHCTPHPYMTGTIEVTE